MSSHARGRSNPTAICAISRNRNRRLLVYPAASDDDIAVIEDDRLAGCNGRLRRIECELGAAVLERADASR